jgi:hypothetical protein
MNFIPKILHDEHFGAYLFRVAAVNGYSARAVLDRARYDNNFYQYILDQNGICEETISKNHALPITSPKQRNSINHKWPTSIPYSLYNIYYNYCEACEESDLADLGYRYFKSYAQPACVFACVRHKKVYSSTKRMFFSRTPYSHIEHSTLLSDADPLLKSSKIVHDIFTQKRPNIPVTKVKKELLKKVSDQVNLKSIINERTPKKSLRHITEKFYYCLPDQKNIIFKNLFINNTSVSELIFYASVVFNDHEISSNFEID